MNIGETLTFNYTGAQQSVTLNPGTYQLQCYGAKGGCTNGGNGGYSKGDITITQNTTLYIYVGGAGKSLGGTGSYSYGTPDIKLGTREGMGGGGWNGGGNASGYPGGYFSGGGGGATDIRIGGTSLNHRIIVAGGGGGGHYNASSSSSAPDHAGGAGGGTTGGTGDGTTGSNTSYSWDRRGRGGTQTSGGAGGFCGDTITSSSTDYYSSSGSFGNGGSGFSGTSSSYYLRTPGGGGGWYGGGGGGNTSKTYAGTGMGAGGGSGYLSPQLTNTSMSSGVQSGNGVAYITFLKAAPGMADIKYHLQNVNLNGYTLKESSEIYYSGSGEITSIKSFSGFTYSSQNSTYSSSTGRVIINVYYTRNSYSLTVNYGTSSKYQYLYEEQGDLHYTGHPVDYLHKFKNWAGNVPVDIGLSYLFNTTFIMPASDVTISVVFEDQDRVNSNIYKNILNALLFDLYGIQDSIHDIYKQETNIFQYNHQLSLYDLVYLDNHGLYHKGLANEDKYMVIGMVSKVISANEFVLMIYGQIEIELNYGSDSGILYLSDTQEGKFCPFEGIITNFYTPIGFYTGNTITINILDSSVGDEIKKYHDAIYEQNLPQITAQEKQSIIQEVLNNA